MKGFFFFFNYLSLIWLIHGSTNFNFMPTRSLLFFHLQILLLNYKPKMNVNKNVRILQLFLLNGFKNKGELKREWWRFKESREGETKKREPSFSTERVFFFAVNIVWWFVLILLDESMSDVVRRVDLIISSLFIMFLNYLLIIP